VTLTATVAAASGGPATGTIAFTSNGTAITAVYTATNSSNFATSTGAMTQTVYLEGTTPSIETGLPYGSWILTVSYSTDTPTTYTLLINLSGVYVNGVKATTFPINLSD
jgi:hypothetical protein